MRVLIVEPGKTPRQSEIRRKLSSMQEVVGGTIQVIYPFEDPVALVCNDEGKLMGLPMGMAPCYTNHTSITQDDQEMATALLAMAGANYYMGVPLGDDVMPVSYTHLTLPTSELV